MTTTTAARKAQSNNKGTSVRTAPKAAPKATPKALTDAEVQAQLDSLVQAVVTGFTHTDSLHTDALKAEEQAKQALSLAEQAKVTRGNARVATARAVAMLAKHPATFYRGAPALSKVATLTGIARNTLRPAWDAAEKLTQKKWEARNSAPTEAERTIADSFYEKQTQTKIAGDAERKAAGANSTTSTVKAVKAGSLEDVVAILADALKVVQAFTANHGITESQFEGLGKQIDLIHDALETSVAGTVAAELEADDSTDSE